jgi:hypothetical protein
MFTVTVLHPRHKLSYFKNAGWEEEWVDTAEHIVRCKYDDSYSHFGHSKDSEEGTEGPVVNKNAVTTVHLIHYTLFPYCLPVPLRVQ